MANPPATIGPFSNVPAPGSPIRSDWPQQITTYVVALSARTVTTYAIAQVGSDITLATTYQIVSTNISLPAAPAGSILLVSAVVKVDNTAANPGNIIAQATVTVGSLLSLETTAACHASGTTTATVLMRVGAPTSPATLQIRARAASVAPAPSFVCRVGYVSGWAEIITPFSA